MPRKHGAITFEAHEVRIDFTPKYVNWDSPRGAGRNRKILMQAQHSLEIMGARILSLINPEGLYKRPDLPDPQEPIMTGIPGLNIPRSAVYFQDPPPPRKWALVPLEDFENLISQRRSEIW